MTRFGLSVAALLIGLGGTASAHLYLALNDPVGKWTLIARDVATGLRQATQIEVGGTP